MSVGSPWTIGDVTVTRVVEQQIELPPDALIGGIDPARLATHEDWLRPHFMNERGEITISIHALVVQTPEATIVVDTCMGNDRPLPVGLGPFSFPFLADFEQVVPRKQVDIVLCTHLHFDHVGWNTMLVDGEFVPTFPNARYLFGRTEYEHWSATTDDSVDLRFGVQPVIDAGLSDLVETDHRITDEVTLVPTPGHTPGHVSVAIESQGQRAVITGDMVHHPVQLAEPTWGSHPDAEPERATQTRRAFVTRYGDQPVLVIGTHFSGPAAGHIVRVGDSCRLDCGE